MSVGQRLAYVFAVVGLLATTLGQSAPSAAGRDEPCGWLDLEQYTYIDELNFLGALGCRLNSRGEWVEGRILDKQQTLTDVPVRHRTEVDAFVEGMLDEVDRMMSDHRMSRYYSYDVDRGILSPGPDFYANPADDNGPIEMAGMPICQGGGWPAQEDPYAEAAVAYLVLPGSEELAGFATWYMKWRDDAADSIVEANFSSPLGKKTIYGNSEYGTIPRPWQLADRNALTVFALWAIERYGEDWFRTA